MNAISFGDKFVLTNARSNADNDISAGLGSRGVKTRAVRINDPKEEKADIGVATEKDAETLDYLRSKFIKDRDLRDFFQGSPRLNASKSTLG